MKMHLVVLRQIGRVLPVMLVALVLASCNSHMGSGEARKSQLKVLYVGTDPNQPLSESDKFKTPAPERAVELRKTRAADFEALLKQYFETVSVVYGADYQEQMSDSYDVTIIDTYLPARPGGNSIDPDTGELIHAPRKYLSDEYGAATIMIGEPSAFIGSSRQLKIDHMCLCLDAHAHGMKLDHAIFNTPYKVSISYEQRETPGNYQARYSGRHLGDTMPMWRVQTEGYMDGKGFPIGLVSTGYGFDNGIDAEWISAGSNGKGIEATAIGRHANFFHWGFAAAPEYMTDSAKLAFINSIHYIASFKNVKQVTRKIGSIKLSGHHREQLWMLSDEGAAAWLAYLDKARQSSIRKRTELKARKEAGEVLSEFETMALDFPPPPEETREWTIRHQPKELKQRFGENWAAYEQYYIENMDYFYPVPGRGAMCAVDEDAKALGIAVNDIRILENAVGMLKSGDRAGIAMGLLTRYTNERFKTPGEWDSWLKANKARLYFSEGDGYKFVVVPNS